MNKQFTLIELMTSITIISIISSLIMPSFSRTRQQAYMTSCKNNLKNIALINSIYTDDHKGLVIPADFGNTNEGELHHWANYIGFINISENILKCPSLDEDEHFDPAGHDPTTGNIYTQASYIMNIIPSNAWNGSPFEISGMGWAYDPETPININDVSKPFNTLYMTDVLADLSNSHIGINSFSKTDWGELLTPPLGNVRRVGIHHLGNFNASFGDGSVHRIKQTHPDQWNTQQ
ncbi:prepilin-type N-terminal cleavage/methylation domain-containing protein [Lentisphaera profundi]|uniref:Prepilin-type N-terminal cleavage/methylation domain-containing protein n=1 Tax=Lentisphaera profundi TaxID=1658616 RepID=A0ABY7VRR9_9BACT|nr:prepilin-type N-terminal cleavage/methylation domain-containing protein [Lentisphaera profundi]WDE95933.1 prepilin-type N-terminal cleavage/methylation domain-containing protein [Lentisphaera profundi]